MLPRRRKSIRNEQQGSIADQLLSLSLFLMLLAFFIVLNAISNFDEAKTGSIRQSLEYTFIGTVSPQDGRDASITPNEDIISTGSGPLPHRIDRLFRAQIAGTQSRTDMQNGTLYLRVPRAEFERMLDAMQSGSEIPREQPFLSTLVSLLKSDGRRQAYRMDITYNLDQNPGRMAHRAPEDVRDEIRAAARAATVIESAGLPAYMMTIGLQRGQTQYVEMTFSPHPLQGGEGGQNDQ